MTPKSLDSEKVLNAIEIQQGILVERAEDTYSFSHLTLQEYLTAQYLVNNSEWESLVQKNLTDSRWREILLLLPGLMPSRSGADNFLLAMEKQSRTYLDSPELQPLVQWAGTSTAGSDGTAPPSVKRVSAIFFALASDLDLALARALARALASDSDSTHTLFHSSAIARDIAHAHAHACIFSNFNSDELMRDIEELEKDRPEENTSRMEVAQFLKKLLALWFSALGIGHCWQTPEVAKNR